MMVNIYFCLPVFVLNSYVTAVNIEQPKPYVFFNYVYFSLGTIIENVTEGSSISLRCPRDYGGSHVPERSRKLKAGRFDVSTENKTLTIRNVKPKDSGLYYCDGKPDLYVNVSKRSDRGKKSTVATTTMTVPSTVQTKDTTPKPNTGKKSTVATTTMTVPSTLQTKDTTLSTVTTVSTPKPNTERGSKGVQSNKALIENS
ncbi:hepatitis A virus cellular receptor 1-like [Cololabis saira]|uniref:hepatitis A virus cellular receptor 1-like n=1 Tax=Cololabis saira TaxID=129043 RepID=UPI002AD29DEE|nr:hepatitis A virus cellular receptor 1-like [Cololabis saira]